MKPKDRKLCEVADCNRRRLFIYHGRVKIDKKHRLCGMHYRSQMAQLWSRILKERNGSQVQSYAPRTAGLAISARHEMATGVES